MESILVNATQNAYCLTTDQIKRSLNEFGILVDEYAGKTDYFGCPSPCSYMVFVSKLNEYHRTSWVTETGVNDDRLKLDISLATDTLEVQTETLI